MLTWLDGSALKENFAVLIARLAAIGALETRPDALSTHGTCCSTCSTHALLSLTAWPGMHSECQAITVSERQRGRKNGPETTYSYIYLSTCFWSTTTTEILRFQWMSSLIKMCFKCKCFGNVIHKWQGFSMDHTLHTLVDKVMMNNQCVCSWWWITVMSCSRSQNYCHLSTHAAS